MTQDQKRVKVKLKITRNKSQVKIYSSQQTQAKYFLNQEQTRNKNFIIQYPMLNFQECQDPRLTSSKKQDKTWLSSKKSLL
jgi:hypothetical protein